ncbi:MAG: ABC transporter substrate-binding protein [Pseudomonadota bacterium]
MMILKTLLAACLAVGALVFTGPALAQEAPDVLVKRITREVMATAKSDREIKAGNRKRIHEVVETMILPHLDFRRATAMTLGRYWRQATPQQQQQLIDEFRALMMYTYAGAMSQIGDQELEYKPLRAGPDDTEVEVHFQVRQTRGSEPVQVAYRLYKTPDGWKVYDVNVMGAWLIETYKNSFSTEIDKGGIDGLIRTLSEKNRKLAAQANGSGRRP